MWYHLYVESELAKHKGTYLQNRNVVKENRLVIAKGQSGWERERLGVWGLVGATIVYVIDHQQGSTVVAREFRSQYL